MAHKKSTRRHHRELRILALFLQDAAQQIRADICREKVDAFINGNTNE